MRKDPSRPGPPSPCSPPGYSGAGSVLGWASRWPPLHQLASAPLTISGASLCFQMNETQAGTVGFIGVQLEEKALKGEDCQPRPGAVAGVGGGLCQGHSQ